MDIQRHARRTLRARATWTLTIALLLATLGSPAMAAPPTSPAALSAATPPVLAAKAAAAKGRTAWSRRRAAVRFAHAQIGKPYRWGGAGPGSYDCSGLTRAAWANGGRSLPHSSRMQHRSTRRVPHRKMRVGDLLFHGSPVSHVAIYVGNGKMIEAPRAGLRVRKVSANRSDRVGIGRP